MEFTLISQAKLKVSISAKELEICGISYEEMEYSDNEFRELLLEILESGRDKTGFNPIKAKLFIQVLPNEDGGCVIIFTALSEGQSSPTQMTGCVAAVFIFDNIDNLIEASVKTYAQYGHRIYKSSLYKMDKTYRLIVHSLDYIDRQSMLFISEYAKKSGEGEILTAYIEEHGKVIIQDNALEVLAEHFG